MLTGSSHFRGKKKQKEEEKDEDKGDRSYFAGNVAIHNLLDFAVLSTSNLMKLGHGDIHFDACSSNDSCGSCRSVKGQLRTDYIHLCSTLDVDAVRPDANAVRVFVVERFAGIVLAEVYVGVSRWGNVDLVNYSGVNQGECPGRIRPSRRQAGEDNASHLRSFRKDSSAFFFFFFFLLLLD